MGSGSCDFQLSLRIGSLSFVPNQEGVGLVFSNHHIFKCSGPPSLYFLTNPLLYKACR